MIASSFTRRYERFMGCARRQPENPEGFRGKGEHYLVAVQGYLAHNKPPQP
jgi:hypothetical protein